jgi:hypothetical protein
MHRKSKDQKNSRELVTKKMQDELSGNPDPKLQDHLIPSFALGCRRMTPGQGYLNALGKDNVRVVKQGVTRLTQDGVVDESGEEHKVDVVICATGFGHLFFPHFKCVGRGGIDLEKQFGEHPKAYLSVMTENFPNLFLIIGPNGPGSHGSLLQIIEWHTRYMFKMVNKLQRENIKSFEPKPEAMLDFYNYTHEMFKRLVWSSVCRAWFKNGKTHGPVTGVYPGSRLHYFELLKEPRFEDYAIKYLSTNRFQFLGNGYTETETTADGNPVWYMDVLRDEDTIHQATQHQSGEKPPSKGIPR